jgi:hypothetical protein
MAELVFGIVYCGGKRNYPFDFATVRIRTFGMFTVRIRTPTFDPLVGKIECGV